MSLFRNGARVYRLWCDQSGELVAEFQYSQHAIVWASRSLFSDFLTSGKTGDVRLLVVGQGSDTTFQIFTPQQESKP